MYNNEMLLFFQFVSQSMDSEIVQIQEKMEQFQKTQFFIGESALWMRVIWKIF